MKRIVVSLGILISLVVLSVSSLFILHYQSERFIGQLNTVEQAVASAETEAKLAAYDDLMMQWEYFHDIAGVFVEGTKLDPIYKQLVGLRPMIEAAHSEVLSELARVRGLAENLFSEELPDWWHIL